MLELPWPPRALSPNARAHWAVKAKAAKGYRKACWAIAYGMKVDEADRYIIRFEFFRPSQRHFDDDNLLAMTKSARDGIADALGVNDNLFTVSHVVHTMVVPGGMILCDVYPDVDRPAAE